MSTRCRGDDGSSLMLMPAGIMVVLVLGAIAVDLSVVRLAHRDLLDIASSAANDAATAGIDPDTLRADGTARIDAGRATDVVHRSLVTHRVESRVAVLLVEVGPAPDQVTVELSMPVEYIFAKAIPGANDRTTVRARASATALRR